MRFLLLAFGLILVASTSVVLTNDVEAAEGDLLKPRIVDWQSEIIRAIAFNSDGTILAVSPKDNDFWLADPTTAKKTIDIKAARGPATALFAASKPDQIFSMEGTVLRLIDLKSGQELAMHGLSQGATGNSFLSADGKLFGFGSASGGIEVLASNLKESLAAWLPKDKPATPADFKCSAAAISADGIHAAAGRPNGKLFLFSIQGHEQTSEQALAGHEAALEGVAFTSAGLVSLGRDGKVKTWDVEDGKEIATHDFETPLERGWLLASGQVAAIIRQPGAGEIQLHRLPSKMGEQAKLIGTINIDDVFDGFPIRTREFVVPHLALSPDGKFLAVAIQAGQVELTNARVGLYDVAAIMPQTSVSKLPPKPSVAETNNPRVKPTPAIAPRIEEERTWKTADGMFEVIAQLVSFSNGMVKLKRADNGKIISIKLSQLSADDQAFIKAKR